MEAILQSPGNRVQGFLAAGHVGAVMGTAELRQLVARQRVPVVVTGFEPLDVMAGLLRLVQLLEAGTPVLANAYGRVVRERGNPAAQALLAEVLTVVDVPWRGLGPIAGGGFALAPAYRHFDALERFGRIPAPVSAPASLDRTSSPRPAGGVPGLRPGLHPGAPAGGTDGVERRGLRRLLPLPVTGRMRERHG